MKCVRKCVESHGGRSKEVGGDGNFWEIQGDWRAEIGGAWGAGGERVREVWGGGRSGSGLTFFRPLAAQSELWFGVWSALNSKLLCSFGQ